MAAINGLPFELRFWPQGQAPATTNFALNGTTDQIEWIFQAADAITITRLGFRYGVRALTPPTYILSLQGVTDGVPDGTIKGGGSPASVTFTPPADTSWNGIWQWFDLANAYTCARGGSLAMVIAYSSGTVDATNNSSFTGTLGVGSTPGIPYYIQNDAGSRTKQAAPAVFGYGSAGMAYGQPVETGINVGFNSGSAADERALLLNIPTTWWSTYKIIGATLYSTFAAATTYDLVLYDTNGSSVLQTVNMDSDNDQSAIASRARQVLFDEATLSTLNAGSNYYLALKPAGTSLTLAGMTVDVAADLEAWAGGSVATAATRVDGGSWTPDPLTRFGINPILADITAPTEGSTPFVGADEGMLFQFSESW